MKSNSKVSNMVLRSRRITLIYNETGKGTGMKFLLKIARIVESAQSLVELVKLALITVICWQAFSFGATVLNRMEHIEHMLTAATAGMTQFADKTKEISGQVVSQEFVEKTDEMTEKVVGAKNNFVDRWRERREK